MQRRALDVAVAERVDLRFRARALRERIVCGNAPVVVQPHDLSRVVVEALCAVLLAAVALLGIVPPLVVPAAVSLLLAAVLFWVPDADLRRRAQTERDAMRLAVCAYLELVALERAGDAGTVQALERAAWVADAPGFVRIRDSLTRAELAGRPPWGALSELAEQVGVPELGDLADIMRLSGTDGAAVYATLRARAASLRHQLLAASAAEANAASEHMIIPVALLGIAFMALIGYPAFARILFS